MLDAISDFWKPSKKTDGDAPLDISALKVGASIGFGFIPQAALTGKRAVIHAINTYEFSGDRLTSYVLDVAGDTSISLIIADGEGEKYIALSRRLPLAERAALFDNSDLLAAMDDSEHKRLNTKPVAGEWKEWVADSYKKAIHGLQGKMTAGDYRSLSSLPDHAESKEFTYSLLVSNNNEYALEIEQYNDNRMEVFATVYRRLSDIGEIKAEAAQATPTAAPKAKPVASTARELSALKPANDSKASEAPKSATILTPPPFETKPPLVLGPPEEAAAPLKPQPKVEAAPAAKAEVKAENPVVQADKSETKSLQLKPFSTSDLPIPERFEPHLELHAPAKEIPDFEPVKAVVPTIKTLEQSNAPLLPKMPPPSKDEVHKTPTYAPAKTRDAVNESFIAKPIEPFYSHAEPEQPSETEKSAVVDTSESPAISNAPTTLPVQEHQLQTSPIKETPMATYNATFNGKAETPAADVRSARAISGQQLEVENDSVECELRAANRIIEEAIRGEMRMSDVVRRIIALPVAQQEQVEIPVMLTDSDYHLLAIRYGIPAADRAAIKAKIIEEINDFSGSNR